MSLTPGTAPGQEPPAAAPAEQPKGRVRLHLWTVCFGLLALEIGVFLLVFPWLDSWSFNHLPSFLPEIRDQFQDLWDDPYFKGGVSGLGVLNILIAVRQISYLRRKPQKPAA